MSSRYRFAVSPRWLAGHVIVLALVVTMVLLGHWQLDVSNAEHFSLQNFGYALQWWAFSLFTVVMWVRIMRDVPRRERAGVPSVQADVLAPAAPSAQSAEPHRPAGAPVAYRRYVMPQSSDGPPVASDAEHAAYNDYLARLAALAADARPRAGEETRS